MNNSYLPEQPFFKLSTRQFVSRVGSTSGQLAQYYSFEVPSEEDHAIVAVPDGTIDILFHCTASTPTASVCGSVIKGKQIEFKKGGRYFGARFLPGTAKQILKSPLSHFTDQEILLEDIQSNSDEFVELICGAPSFDEKIALFEKYYTRCNSDKDCAPSLISFLLEKINASCGEIRIQELADETGYSTRHVSNIFKKYVGISPKLFSRIVRFQKSFSLLRLQKKATFADLAQDAGYYDQAHFINEFKEFSMSTPTQIIHGSFC
nr:helix-turn-helix domain-containing protein [uncultured Desulfobacter sp.]